MASSMYLVYYLITLNNKWSRVFVGKTKSHFPEEAPGWEEVLASDSKAIVKSERAENKSIKEMQDQTIECLHDEIEEGPEVGRSTEPNP